MDKWEVEQIETELRSGLRHVPAPEGFKEQVMARVLQHQPRHTVVVEQRRRYLPVISIRQAWLTAAAAALIVAVGGGDLLHDRNQQHAQKAAAAQAEIDRAMLLTSHALAEVETGLDRSSAGRFTHLLEAR